MEQQQPKATTAAKFATPPTRDVYSMAKHYSGLNQFICCRSWPIPPNGNEVPAPTFIKMEKSDEKAQPKQAVICCPMVLGNPPQNNESSGELCGWVPQFPICVQPAPNLKAEDSKEEDWNGDRQKQRKKISRKEITIPQAHSTPHPITSQDRLSHHYKTEEERKERLEFLNDKYDLDYYSDSNSDSEHEYEKFV